MKYILNYMKERLIMDMTFIFIMDLIGGLKRVVVMEEGVVKAFRLFGRKVVENRLYVKCRQIGWVGYT